MPACSISTQVTATSLSSLRQTMKTPRIQTKITSIVFNMIVEDSSGLTATKPVLLAVEPVAANLSLSIADFDMDEGETFAVTAVAGNNDSSNTITYAIGDAGADGDLFEIDEYSGVLSFISAPDAEDPLDAASSNTYVVEIVATDESGEAKTTNGDLKTASTSITITVNDIEDEATCLNRRFS